MRKIKIIKGQNFGIHVEKKIEKENFFFHEYEMAVEYLNHIWDSQTACLQVQDDLFVENPNNVIAFCGERGSGKSSAMLSFINALRQVGKNDDEFDFSNPVRNNNWDSKVIIDPSAFDGVHNIVDIVLAHIFQSFNDAYQEDNQSFDKYDRERLYKLMAKVYKNLSIIKNKENLEVADISAAFADYASAGYDVVIGHGYEFGDPALEVAETYPDTKFICTEADASADNVASYVMACEQTAYVEGIIAASTSESGKLGAIGPIPGDSLVKIINGYEDGAKSVNPDIEVQTAWTNSFVDTQLAQEAAKAMIDNGVDVIKHCANACGNGAMTAAVEAGIWCQGDSYDQSSLAPDNILDSAIYNLDVVIDTALGSVADGSFEGDVYNLGMADGAVEVLLSDNLSDDVKATAQDAIDKIVSGELEVERDYTMRQ